MAADIVTTLQLDKESSGRVIAVKEIINCDSSFIISCVLSHCIKNKYPVVLVSTHNSLSHYQNVGIKMNYSLQKHIESGLIKFCDLGNEFVNNLMKNQDVPIVDLLRKVTETIAQMRDKYEVVNIILDGMTHLFDMDYTLSDVNSLCNEIIKEARYNNNKSFLMVHCNVASDEDVSHVMGNLLSHKSDLLLEVENLPSGWSADVSGHLTIKYIGKKFEDEHIFSTDLKSNKYLFKLFDRGVKLLAPGTV